MVGKFMNQRGWSDVEPFEIVRVVSDKQVVVRGMTCTLSPEWKPQMSVGGFWGHVENNRSQEWVIVSDPTAPEFRVRLGKKGWKDAHGQQYSLADAPRKFHDYNF
jgi:hypothetical protein